MSWIKDVKQELRDLEISKKILRKFGLLVGTVFLLIGYWVYHSYQSPAFIIVLTAGTSLIISGSLFPKVLSSVYKIWMGLAFALGWLMSRVLLLILFYLVLTPISLIAKLIGKSFLDKNFNDKRDSYWVIRDTSKKVDYTKMY
jgi:hypothetical protein